PNSSLNTIIEENLSNNSSQMTKGNNNYSSGINDAEKNKK
ncbi:hypothetical protein H311_00645, partial [Anncaliia algerae PRA109]